MYWYNNRILYRAALVGGVVFASLFTACRPDVKQANGDLKYFDLKGYFKTTSAGLTAKNKPVIKTVRHNKVIETKTVTIDNWDRELSLFGAADINKPAWKNSYTVSASPNTLIYKAISPDLETREIVINKAGDKVKWIMIVNHTKNLLYETREKLTWFPDSIYQIQKWQHVRLMGTNQYDIKGLLK